MKKELSNTYIEDVINQEKKGKSDYSVDENGLKKSKGPLVFGSIVAGINYAGSTSYSVIEKIKELLQNNVDIENISKLSLILEESLRTIPASLVVGAGAFLLYKGFNYLYKKI